MLLPVLLAVASAGCSGPVQHVDPGNLKNRMQQMVDSGCTPSVVYVGVHRDGRRVELAVGESDVKAGTRARADMPYMWFSVTKLFTAVAVMQLVDRGQLDLDRPVRELVPEFPDGKCDKPVRVRHLLAHTSGLPNPMPLSWVHLAEEQGPSLDELANKVVVPHKPSCDPGESYRYSNLGYITLGQIIERVSGMSFGQYMKENVLATLGADRTGLEVPQDVATGYTRSGSMLGMIAPLLVDSRYIADNHKGFTALHRFTVDGAPYGGLVGPATDMALLVEAILNEGVINGRVLLSKEAVAQMLTRETAPDGSTLGVALGWLHGSSDGEPYVHLIGGGGGFKSELRIYPNLGYGMIVLANETGFNTRDLSSFIVSP